MSADSTLPARERPPRILLVDDHADNLALYAQYLTHADFEVHEARDGKEALDQARQVAPDLIVMDLGLPVIGLRARYPAETTTILVDRRHAGRRQTRQRVPRDRRRGERRRPLAPADEALWGTAHCRFVSRMGT